MNIQDLEQPDFPLATLVVSDGDRDEVANDAATDVLGLFQRALVRSSLVALASTTLSFLRTSAVRHRLWTAQEAVVDARLLPPYERSSALADVASVFDGDMARAIAAEACVPRRSSCTRA